MDSNLLIIAIAFASLVAGTLVYLFIRQRRELRQMQQQNPGTGKDDTSTRPLQLAAYERLILLVDRIALPNIIQRMNQPDLSAREMQGLLIHTIRQEFEHNITQQIYVSAEAWDAVRNYKEQNLLIINQIASYLPADATALELNKHLLDLLVQNPKASLQNIVSDALSYEAKKLM